jgi:4-hydroxy-tetrahydrodipicolinate reductase
MNICVIGATGRMGSRIVELIDSDEELELTGAVEAEGSNFIGKDICEICKIRKTGIIVKSDLIRAAQNANVLIDFSGEHGTVSNIESYKKLRKPLVVGSTGLDERTLEELRKMSLFCPILVSPNMSTGINLLFKLTEIVSKTLKKDFDIEIIEAHHRNKKDAPSGTAMKLAQVIAETLNRDLEKDAVYFRKGLIGTRTEKEIGIQTIRGGDIVGDHTVMFCGDGERLELVHRASNRDTFARGAIKAALWLANKSAGFYNMSDVLGFKN